MDTDARRMRGERPFVMTNLRKAKASTASSALSRPGEVSPPRREPKQAEPTLLTIFNPANSAVNTFAQARLGEVG